MSDDTSPHPVRVAICIPTFKRPGLLALALESVGRQALPRHLYAEVRVCVVDNDPEGSAMEIIELRRKDIPWPLDYTVEPNRGISHARNRLISLAGNADFVAFLDDDQIAEPGWLDALLTVQSQTLGDVVLGAVLAEFEKTPPSYLHHTYLDCINRGEHPDGSEVGLSAFGTGNLLLRLALLAHNQAPFDPAFGLIGGEDTYFARTLRLQGVRFFWAGSARVREVITSNRTTISWLLRRNYRMGTTVAAIDLRLEPRLGPVKRLLKGIGSMALGTLVLLPSIICSRRNTVRSLCRISKGLGSIAGLAGAQYQEYRSVGDS